MQALTPAERRGAILVVLLLVLGAAHDLWRGSRPLPMRSGPDAAVPSGSAADAGAPAGPGEGGHLRAEGREAPAAPAATVDLNRASAHELDGLPGVGPVLAGRIVAHRDRHGPFRHPEELLAVRGIGPRLFERLKPWITVGTGPPSERRAGSGTSRP